MSEQSREELSFFQKRLREAHGVAAIPTEDAPTDQERIARLERRVELLSEAMAKLVTRLAPPP